MLSELRQAPLLRTRTTIWCAQRAEAGPYLVPGSPHGMLSELRQAPSFRTRMTTYCSPPSASRPSRGCARATTVRERRLRVRRRLACSDRALCVLARVQARCSSRLCARSGPPPLRPHQSPHQSARTLLQGMRERVPGPTPKAPQPHSLTASQPGQPASVTASQLRRQKCEHMRVW